MRGIRRIERKGKKNNINTEHCVEEEVEDKYHRRKKYQRNIIRRKNTLELQVEPQDHQARPGCSEIHLMRLDLTDCRLAGSHYNGIKKMKE